MRSELRSGEEASSSSRAEENGHLSPLKNVVPESCDAGRICQQILGLLEAYNVNLVIAEEREQEGEPPVRERVETPERLVCVPVEPEDITRVADKREVRAGRSRRERSGALCRGRML